MRYRVYSGPKGSEDVSPMTKDQMLFKEFASARRGPVMGAPSWRRAAACRC